MTTILVSNLQRIMNIRSTFTVLADYFFTLMEKLISEISVILVKTEQKHSEMVNSKNR